MSKYFRQKKRNTSTRREIQTDRVLGFNSKKLILPQKNLEKKIFLSQEKSLDQILASNTAVSKKKRKYISYPFRNSLLKAIRDTLASTVNWMTIHSSLIRILLYDFEIKPETWQQLTRYKSNKTLLGTHTCKSKNTTTEKQNSRLRG